MNSSRKRFGIHGRPKYFVIFKPQNIAACEELVLINLNKTRLY